MFDDQFSSFNTVPARDGRTDGQTDKIVIGLSLSRSAWLCYAGARDKNASEIGIYWYVLTTSNCNICSSSLNVFSETLLYAVARPSVACLSVDCLSVTFVHPIQPVEILGNVSTPFGTLATPPAGKLNARGVAKYSDFGPIEGYISETVQDHRR